MLIRSLLCALAVYFASVPAYAEVRLAVAYNEAADLFSLMDNVSEWETGFTDPLYRAEWTKRFGWSAKDQAMADRYREYRNRTMTDVAPDGIFATDTATSDPLAAYFLGQGSISAALSDLDRSMKPADATMLRAFYGHFAPKWRVLIGGSKLLVDGALQLEQMLGTPKVATFVDRMAQFYGVKVDGNFTVYFTRYPPGAKSSAHVVAGRYFLLHSPFGTKVTAADWDEIVMHELAHFMSMQQPLAQKQALTAQFLGRCPIPAGISPYWLVEEPLAVAWGQAAYSIKVKDRPLDPMQNWYSKPWIDLVSRAIAPSIIYGYDKGATINDGIVTEAADRCKSLSAISATIQSATPR